MDRTTSTTSDGADSEQWGSKGSTGEQPQMLTTAVGDQCANCGAPLAADQRYCVSCGERRGRPRYALPAATSGGSSGATALPAQAPRGSWNSSASLIAGVATLLLAMGVGVLIGRTTAGSSTRGGVETVIEKGAVASAAPAVVTTAPTVAGTGSGATTTPSAGSKTKKASSKTPMPPAFKKIPPKLQSSAVKLGQKGTGKGYTNGKFTGNFFGSGG